MIDDNFSSIIYHVVKKINSSSFNDEYDFDKFCESFQNLELPEHNLISYAKALAALRLENNKDTVLEELEYLVDEWPTISEDISGGEGDEGGDIPTNNISYGAFASVLTEPFKKNRNVKIKIFKTNSQEYYKAIMGKKKYAKYGTVLAPFLAGEISEYAKKNPKNHIVLQDEVTGACVFLRKKDK